MYVVLLEHALFACVPNDLVIYCWVPADAAAAVAESDGELVHSMQRQDLEACLVKRQKTFRRLNDSC
jgi:hypothetical protein